MDIHAKVVRIAVAGAGAFGRNHIRVLKELPGAELTGIYDLNPEHAAAVAAEFGVRTFSSLTELAQNAEACVVAVPTIAHAEVGCALMEAGLDILVEKPIALDIASGARLVETAQKQQRILQVGHLERFNPAVTALAKAVTLPLFFEIHRLSIFTPRSLDVDVVLDLMIHDIEILLGLIGKLPVSIEAAGIQILSGKVDIANVRMAFPGGVIANLTASRASTEKVRKMRVFQPGAYLSLDYSKQELFGIEVGTQQQVRIKPFAVVKNEPLRLELEAFLHSVRSREKPKVDGETSLQALKVAMEVVDKIELHARVVRETLQDAGYSAI
ncbi:Gfo/Idh/MocA family protein [Bryobacter aggregatus]|uniref:Gfo/Idh/MocA family protein n=1 Tax=Bryobacter aggregatus TaxID=360054 RepID=UPI000A89FAF2|nr:Gfo/Idh/MocA family oxidoreductase [Bryobacter aggregatus]